MYRTKLAAKTYKTTYKMIIHRFNLLPLLFVVTESDFCKTVISMNNAGPDTAGDLSSMARDDV